MIENADPQRPGPDQPAGSAASRPTEANNLVTVLKFGSLPFPIQELSSEQISATLGEQFLEQSLLGGRDRDRMVVVFMLVYYRLPGVVAAFALICTRSSCYASSGSCR